MYSKAVVLSILVTLLSSSLSVSATPAAAALSVDSAPAESYSIDQPFLGKRDDADDIVDGTELDVEEIADADFEEPTLVPRAQRTCKNDGRLRRKKFVGQGCDPKKSKGPRSSHNCPGKAYLCVENGKATCYSGGAVKKLGAEGGECFL